MINVDHIKPTVEQGADCLWAAHELEESSAALARIVERYNRLTADLRRSIEIAVERHQDNLREADAQLRSLGINLDYASWTLDVPRPLSLADDPASAAIRLLEALEGDCG